MDAEPGGGQVAGERAFDSCFSEDDLADPDCKGAAPRGPAVISAP